MSPRAHHAHRLRPARYITSPQRYASPTPLRLSKNAMTSPLPEFDASLDFKFSQPPNPSWTYGQGVDATPDGKQWLDGENAGWKVVDAATEDPA